MRKRVSRVAVVGAGLMGSGIGQSFAASGYKVTLIDVEQGILKVSLQKVKETLLGMSSQGLLNDESPQSIVDRITLETDVAKGVSNADFVEEAITENLDAKKKLFAKMDSSTGDSGTILASNTSGFPISSIASLSKRQERIVGAHFWNPPHLMRAVEVVKGQKTSDGTLEGTVSILKSIGKKPAVVQKDVPGQIGIRILYAMIREATWLVENGIATAEDIDMVVKEALGTRLEVLGPLELADLSGVDLVDSVAKTVYKSLDSSKEPQRLLRDMVERGQVGIKSGKGFYEWGKNGRDVKQIIKLRDEHLASMLRRKESSLKQR